MSMDLLKRRFSQNLQLIKSELNHSKLLIVSKTRSLEEIKIYYELGHRDFGENKVQELMLKATELADICPEIRWHMIGHLQTNKINTLLKVPHLFAIHSVDRRELVDHLLKAGLKVTTPIHVFLQFNTSHEAEKSGFETYSQLLECAELILSSSHYKLAGLMTMGTLRTQEFESEAGRCFQDLVVEKTKLEEQLKIKLQTSMGMSQDYKIALREKSDWIRLGTIMFEKDL